MSDRLLQPRNRLVNFRVTETEYTQIREACLASGCRGLSAYARWATLDSMRRRRKAEPVGTSRETLAKWLDQRLTSLETSIRRLLTILNSDGAEKPVEKQ